MKTAILLLLCAAWGLHLVRAVLVVLAAKRSSNWCLEGHCVNTNNRRWRWEKVKVWE